MGEGRALVCETRTAAAAADPADALLAAAKSGIAALAAQGGDYAFAMLDEQRKSLTLGLAPLSELQLFYFRDEQSGTVHFSTDLRTLVRERRPGLDFQALAQIYQIPIFQREAAIAYEGVRQLAAGTIVRFDETGQSVTRFWDVPEPQSERISLSEAADELRAALDQAIADRLLALPGAVGSQLSAGRDSGAATTACASALAKQGRQLDAWTAAALPGVVHAGTQLIDEAPLAGRTAARFGNIRHHVLGPEPFDLCTRLDQLHRELAQPLFQPIALGWCEPLWDAAEASGNDLLLCGDFGNYALSAGGPWFLQDVRAEEGTLRLLGQAGALALRHPGSLRSLVAQLRHRTFLAASWHSEPLAPFLKGDFARSWRRQHETGGEEQPPYRRWLQEGIAPHLHPKNIVRVGRQLECTDPTRDRRVVEAIHRLPSRLLFSARDRRPVFERAFADLLPREVLRTHLSGVQNADWHYSLDATRLKSGLARYRDVPLVRAFLDVDALAGALDRWPTRRCLGGEHYRESVFGVLPALSLASFLWVQEQN